ncbi:YihY/virulence factor BrkB family protein [Phototrophicus methaneseepsis]|uniref:YihY/virulence factor BrkB family protein n=1 Tax=Phototrophicus methaneseepsis TaxID=2710758 RepID=A0A7S8E565_9CHLR|nr:YihY/virulence factor BrkB family protein [Phototrophicus methaneseepsis]QPC80557.1 YihY/virulence factor BrkB family protein [Phototrophicus methaneseepsis]
MLRERTEQIRQQVHEMATEWWSQRSEATQLLPGYVWRAVRNYLRGGSRQAAALAYYAIFSVFPLVLLLAVGVGSLVGPAVAQDQIASGLQLFLPETTVIEIQDTIGAAVNQSTEFSLIALAGLVWSATGLFSNITLALDTIFAVPAIRSLWRMRLLAVLMGLTLVTLVLASFITSGVLRLLQTPALELNVWLTIGIWFLPLGLDLVIFALLFRYVPARHVHWDAVWPAAVFGAVGWEVAKQSFEWYLGNLNNFNLIYGGIATGIVLLFWAFLIASIFLFSAELCARLNEWLIDLREREAQRRMEEQPMVTLHGHRRTHFLDS